MPEGRPWWEYADDGLGSPQTDPPRVLAPDLPVPSQYQEPTGQIEEPDPIPDWALRSIPSSGLNPQGEIGRYTENERASSADDFSGLIAAEIQELRKNEYDMSARAWRGAQKVPFLGGFLSADSLLDVYHASERYSKGQYWKSDAKVIAAYMAEAERHNDLAWYEKGAEILLDMPGYAAEIYATGGAMTAGRTLVKKTVTEVAEKMVKRGVLKAIGKRGAARAAAAATRGAGEVAGIAVGGASMAAVSPWLLSEKTSEYAVRNSLAGDDEAFANALWQGPLSSSITAGAEFAGGMTAKALSRMPGISKLKELVFHNLLKRPGATVQSLLQMKERIGWHGMLGEIEEERLDELVHGLTGLSDDYGVIQGIFSDDPERVKSAWDQLKAESLAFGAFGAAFALPNASRYAKGMDTPRQRLEKFLNSQSRGNYNKLDPGIRQRLPNTVVIDGEEVDFDPSKGSHRAAVRPEAERMLQEVDAQVAAAPEEFKTQVAEVAQVVVAEGNAPGRSQEFKGLLTRLEMLLAEDNPGEAILREGITLEELNTIRVQVAGVPATESGQRRTPQQLLLEYPSAARELSQASEVSNDQFKRLTGTALAEGEGFETITEYQDSLRAIVTEKATLGLQTATEQLEAIGQAEMEGQPIQRFGTVGMGGVAGMETMQPPVGQPAAAPVVEGPVAAEPVAAEAPTAADEEGAAARGGAPGEFGQQDVDTGPATAEFGTGEALELYGFALPELVELATNLLEGRAPEMSKRLREVAGMFKGADGQLTSAAILMNPAYAKNIMEATQILAHEIGHLIDYLPHDDALGEATTKRGNILGRLRGLQKYTSDYLAGTIGGPAPLSASEKARLRKEARRLLTNPDIEQEIIDDSDGAFTPEDIVNIFRAANDADINETLLKWFKRLPNDRKSSVVKAALSGILPEDLPTLTGAVQSNLDEMTLDAAEAEILAKYHELLEEEIRKRELLSQNSLREELIELSYWWTPYDESTATAAYRNYRHENKELFAQALSVLLVAPKELKDRAPEFWRGFMAYISRHPEFLKEYQELQDLLAGDSEKLLKHRSGRVLAGFQSAEEALLSVAAAREGARMSGWDTLVQFATQGILDRFAPGKKLAKRARDRGASVKESRNFEALLDEMFTVDAPVHALVMRTQREIVEPLQAAGVSMDQFGEYTMMLRVIMERSEFFNPLGTTAETAAEAINQLQRNLSSEITHPINGSTMTQFELLEEMSLRWHRKIVFPIVKNAVEAGVYSREKVEGPGGLRENIDNYSTFLVLKYITTDERISPMLEKQVGTFGEIANPFVATMLKMVTLHRFNQINGTKNSIVQWLDTYFKDEFEELKPEPGPKGTLREPDPPQDPNRDILKVLVNGDMKYYSVDKAIVKMFMQHDIGTLQSISGLLSSGVYRSFHPLFVTYNPSFIAGNWIRDIQRTHRNLGAQSKRLEYETAQAHLQHIRDTEGREPNQADIAEAQSKGRVMRIGLLDILKERHKLMGWGRVAQFLSGGALKPGPAREFARGEAGKDVQKQIEQMMEEHAYAIPLTEIESQTGKMLPGFLEANLSPRERAAKEIKRLRELDDPSMLEKFKSKVLPAWGHMLHAFEVIGAERLKTYAEAQELAGKMTGYNLMEQRGVDTRQRALMTRKDTGTPDFMQRGLVSSLTNSLWMYSKVRWNSLHRDYQMLKGDMPKTRGAWIMHQAIWTLAPTTVVKLAGYGALGFLPFGDELQEWYKLFSKYFVDNYDVIPLGTTQIDGKRHAVGLTIPRDETRSFLAQMWGNAMDAVVESTTDVETQAGSAPKALQDIYDSMATNTVPNLNPYLDIATAWSQYASGMNPRDRFYKGDIVPRSHWEAGGWESNRKMLAWTIKKTGIINTVVHPVTGPILGDAFDDTEEQFQTTTVLRTTPVLQRFLRVSQRGMQDRHWMAMEEERTDAAAFRLQLPKTVRNANGRQYLLSHTQHLLDEDGKQELMVLNKWRSMTYMPAREKMLEATEAGDEQAVQQLREQLSVVTKDVMSNPVANVPDLYLGAIAWQVTNPSFEEPLKSDELKILQANGRGIREIESLIKNEALRRSNMEAERTQKRLGRPYRPRKVPRITKALGERLNNMRRIFSGREPRRRRIGRAGARR